MRQFESCPNRRESSGTQNDGSEIKVCYFVSKWLSINNYILLYIFFVNIDTSIENWPIVYLEIETRATSILSLKNMSHFKPMEARYGRLD